MNESGKQRITKLCSNEETQRKKHNRVAEINKIFSLNHN